MKEAGQGFFNLRFMICDLRTHPRSGFGAAFARQPRKSQIGNPKFEAGVVQQQNAAVPRPRRRCDSVHPLQPSPAAQRRGKAARRSSEIEGGLVLPINVRATAGRPFLFGDVAHQSELS